MNEPTPSPDDLLANASREEILAALFANMVIQQTNMAMMLLGKVPHPETGQTVVDIEAARMFIDQLEMLEAKTKGNLNQQETALLKQALAAVHMTFVEAVNAPATSGAATPAPKKESAPLTESTPAPAQAAPAGEEKKPAPAAPETAPAAEESRKKFSKKY